MVMLFFHHLLLLHFRIQVIAVVFTLTTWLPISSLGMVMFWGIVVKFIWDAIITKNILNSL